MIHGFSGAPRQSYPQEKGDRGRTRPDSAQKKQFKKMEFGVAQSFLADMLFTYQVLSFRFDLPFVSQSLCCCASFFW